MTDSTLWAITAHFNPLHYSCRLQNYRLFKNKLTVPLITVELGYEGRFELEPKDADILLQIQGNYILWQKERLLNIALSKVPKHIKFIAWLDCDIIFDQKDWSEQVANQLESVPIVQTFSQVYRLERNVLPEDAHRHPSNLLRHSSVFLVNQNSSSMKDFHDSTTIRLRKGCVGYGWAARRELLERHGFYDAMIIGGGDLVMACAAYGWFKEAINAALFDERRAAHYLAWARPFFEHVRGKVGCVNGRIFHLWHGDTRNRRYEERHIELAKLNFDPFADIVLTEQGCWALTRKNDRLEAHLKEYFLSRKEDG